MIHKTCAVELKAAADGEYKGEFRAVIATFGVIDKDGDVTEPDAFTDGEQVVVSQYAHSAFRGAMPAGTATIRVTAKAAIAEGRFFMDTSHGRDAFVTVKQLHDAGMGEWSYGYDVIESETGEINGQSVRFLKKVKAWEVSPVMIGAGMDTRTLVAKAGDATVTVEAKWHRAVRPHETAVTAREWDAKGVLDAVPAEASIDALRSVFAYCNGDPAAKSAYQFPHHHGVDGPANVRALVIGIAQLNSKSCTLPEPDRLAVYEHLAAHLKAAGRDVPELRAPDAPLSFVDEIADGLVGLRRIVDAAARVVALRSEQGKGLSRIASEHLEWFEDDVAVLLKQLRELHTTPDDLAAQELARFTRLTFQQENPTP